MDKDNDEGSVVLSNIYGNVCLRRKIRRKRQKALVREMFYGYATNTSLHGLPYTTKRGLTMIEKIFWVITFVASIFLCGYQIRNVWIKWKTSPVIVTVSEKLVPVRTVPFPSVLICPQKKTNVKVYNYTSEKRRLERLDNTSLYEEDFAKFEDVTTVCGRYGIYSEALYKLHRNYADETIAKNIYDVAPKREDVFEHCAQAGQFDYGCALTVSETLTSEGLCFSINSLAVQDIFRNNSINKDITYMTADRPAAHWTNEHGYSHYNSDTYPVPGKESGAFPDFEIVMRDRFPDRDICNIVNNGYKVYIQHPADLPQANLHYFAVLNGMVSSMALSFSILNTSEALRGYDAEIRQCYFPEDRYLKYFKIYTANNCKIECLANVTFEMCNCVAFYMPHESKRICTYASYVCMNKAKDRVVEMEESEENNTCSCLPSCNSIDYQAEILKTDFNLRKLEEAEMQELPPFIKLALLEQKEYSRLELYFTKPRFVSMRRSEIFGVTDFLANIGGLLGLFLGFSFLSLVELFYFITLRLFCTLKKDLREEKMQRKRTLEKRF